MERDRCGLIVLGWNDCLRALSLGALGCLALSHRALPLALPVSYAMDGESIVFRTSSDSTLARTATGSVVSFCAHGATRTAGVTWSVIVTGMVVRVQDRDELRRLSQLPLTTWGSGDTPRVTLRLNPTFMTGRELDPAASSLMALGTTPGHQVTNHDVEGAAHADGQ